MDQQVERDIRQDVAVKLCLVGRLESEKVGGVICREQPHAISCVHNSLDVRSTE
jgi:hypothetical protein